MAFEDGDARPGVEVFVEGRFETCLQAAVMGDRVATILGVALPGVEADAVAREDGCGGVELVVRGSRWSWSERRAR